MDIIERFETKHDNSPVTEPKIKNKDKIIKEKRKSSKTKEITKLRKINRSNSI